MTLSIAMLAVIAIYLVILLVGIIGGLQLRRFLSQTPALRSSRDLDHFRQVVAHNMYLALAIIVLFIVAAVIVVVGLILNWIQWYELLILALLGAIQFLAGLWTKSAEQKVKSILVTTDELHEERDHIVHVWDSKAFPDW